MSDENVVNLGDRFVENRLAKKPVVYSVQITHLVVNGEWTMGIEVLEFMGLSELDEENRKRVAYDLRQAADMVENPYYRAEENPK